MLPEREQEEKKMNEKKKLRRNKIQVLADILEASVDAAPPTRMMSTTNMGRIAFKRHLNRLVSRGFLKKIEQAYSKRLLYQTTQEGEDVLKLIRQLRDTLGEDLWCDRGMS